MAKKVKLTKGGQTVYPATVMDAVVHPDLRVASSKLIEEVNVSKIFPTGGIDGTNKYTLETAIAMIPASLRSVGIKCSFIGDSGTPETWQHMGGTFTDTGSWKQINISEPTATDIDQILALNITYEENAYYINETGEEVYDLNFVTSEFVELNGKKNIIFYGMLHPLVLAVSFWNTDKEFIEGTNVNTTSSEIKLFHVEIVPENAVYVRTSYHHQHPHSLVIEKLYDLSKKVDKIPHLEERISLLEDYNFPEDLFSYAIGTGYIKTDGITIVKDDNWVYTDFISVKEGQQINFQLVQHTALSSVTLYDLEKNVVQNNVGSGNTGYIAETITIPANVRYVRIVGASSKNEPNAEQYAITNANLLERIDSIENKIGNPKSYQILSPYAVYTTCNNVMPSQKGRNRNYSQAIYLDHLFNGLTQELIIRFKDSVDKLVFNAPMVVTDANETSPAVILNGGENIHEEEVSHYVHGKDIVETPIVIKHRSTLNSVTSNAHPKVLCIGDSITYAEQAWIPDDNYTQNYAYHLICKELFMKDK